MAVPDLDDFHRGLVIGVLIGEGSFGGDGRQPQVTLRMHTRHRALFDTLTRCFPRSRLYGPYDHGGRRYYQWMMRGQPLVEDLMPLLDEALNPGIDQHAAARYTLMCERYAGVISRLRARADA
jgi:hypothetical protein